MAQKTFTNLRGVTYNVQPVPTSLVTQALLKIREEWIKNGEPLEAPTFAVTLPGGSIETHTHDEQTLEIPGNPEESAKNKAAWAAYKIATDRFDVLTVKKRTYYWLMEGLDFELPENGWDQRQERRYGVTVPTDPDERRWHYIQTEVVPTVEDMINAMQVIQELSYAGLTSPEEVKAQMDLFRSGIQGATRRIAEAARRRMEIQQGDGRDRDNEGVESTPVGDSENPA